MILYYDRLAEPGLGYPNLAVGQVLARSPAWYQFDHMWPRTVPLRLLLYTRQFFVRTTDQIDEPGWYPIGVGWFDHDLDYFDLLDAKVRHHIYNRDVKILFYYHEGDNPHRIKSRLDVLVKQHGFPPHCYHFISANTVAQQLEDFSYFPDHEYFFRVTNKQPAARPQHQPRFDFTALNRLPKWWRASCMADLWRHDLLSNSLWSYNTAGLDHTESPLENPLELDSRDGWRESVDRFLAITPRFCDGLSADQHNRHSHTNLELYHDSRFHIVFETFLDADQSAGTFLTEKTFKCIKFGQPFVIVGTSGSLQALRDLGYRTFDDVIDPGYDAITDNTLRWNRILATLQHLRDCPEFYTQCLPDCAHNQELFNHNTTALNTLLSKLS